MLKFYAQNGNVLLKKMFPKNNNGEIIGKFTHKRLCRARSHNIPISGPLLQEKALEIAKELGDDNFKASCNWLDKFWKSQKYLRRS